MAVMGIIMVEGKVFAAGKKIHFSGSPSVGQSGTPAFKCHDHADNAWSGVLYICAQGYGHGQGDGGPNECAESYAASVVPHRSG